MSVSRKELSSRQLLKWQQRWHQSRGGINHVRVLIADDHQVTLSDTLSDNTSDHRPNTSQAPQQTITGSSVGPKGLQPHQDNSSQEQAKVKYRPDQ